jgi:hypothetical protein
MVAKKHHTTTKKAPTVVPKRKPAAAPQPKPKPMATKKDNDDAKTSEKKSTGDPVPAGVEEQIRHGGVPADDPSRAPLPESVDHEAQNKNLVDEDRKRFEAQGDKA